MAIQIGQTSFELGMEKGIEKAMEKGIKKGELRIVMRQLQARFGPPKKAVQKRVESLSEDELLTLSDNLLNPGATLVDLGLEDANAEKSANPT